MKTRPDIDNIVEACRLLARKYIDEWQPIDPAWKTIVGCAYIRLSTDQQVIVDKGSLEQQVHMAVLEAEARSKQRRINYRITTFFIEPGVSGRTSNRTEFKAMLKAIGNRTYHFVAFKELSRLTRDARAWMDFFDLCQKMGCEIVIRGLPFDPNEPTEILRFGILAQFAEYESRNTAKRIKDSVFSAMVNNGKFNSTHRRLGLAPLFVDGVQRPGFYRVVPEELETVIWVMRIFVKYGSHRKVLEVCRDKGIKNWNGKPFCRTSLSKLLCDTRYIGKWYKNSGNKDQNQDDLHDRDRYREIDLPHGQIVPLDLWNDVQKTVKTVAGNLGKTTRVSRVFLLSGGILRLYDGSRFRGCSATGKTQKSFYYQTAKNDLRLNAELIEKDVARTVNKLVQNTPELQRAISRAGSEVADNIQILESRLKHLRAELDSLTQEYETHIRKMNVLVQTTDEKEVELFRKAFRKILEDNETKRSDLEAQIKSAQDGLDSLRTRAFSWSEVSAHAARVQEVMAENDPVALKRAYYALFDSIVIGPENELGRREITYVLKDTDVSLEDVNRLRTKMVEVVGIQLGDPHLAPCGRFALTSFACKNIVLIFL